MDYQLPAEYFDVPGVFSATQKRSIKIRDAYLRAGLDLLVNQPLDSLRIPDIAAHCGYSVGSFYTRFQDKDAYFRALRSTAMSLVNAQIQARITPKKLAAMSVAQALEELVDLLIDIFTGAARGVLRETLLRILAPDDPWEPMRESAQRIVKAYQRALGKRLTHCTPAESKARISFCFQAIVGVLQNDLVNDYHQFSTRQKTIREPLRDLVCQYMAVPRS